MTFKAASSTARLFAWVTPFRVALLGTVAVVLLLTMPISIGPGDHEQRDSCGNALRVNLDRWRLPPPENYYDRAHQACTTKRVERIGLAVGVTSVTVLIVTAMTTRGRQRESSPG